jgi:hypothetical protein
MQPSSQDIAKLPDIRLVRDSRTSVAALLQYTGHFGEMNIEEPRALDPKDDTAEEAPDF